MLPKPKIAKSSSTATDMHKFDWDTHRVEIFAMLLLERLQTWEFINQKDLEAELQRHTGYQRGLGTSQLEWLREKGIIQTNPNDPSATHQLQLTAHGRQVAQNLPKLIPFKQILMPDGGPSIDLDRDRLAKMGQPIMREEAPEPIRPEDVKIATNQRKRVTVGTPAGIRLDPPSAEVGQGGAPTSETPADEPEQSEALQAAMATVGLPKMKMTEPYDGKPATDTSRMRRKHGV